MTNKIAVGYVRVSTEEQTLNYSLDYQEEYIQKYCEEKTFFLKQFIMKDLVQVQVLKTALSSNK